MSQERFDKSIPAAEGLATTLRFLATGDSQQSLSFSYRLGKATVSKISLETCKGIYTALKDPYLTSLDSKEEWPEISKKFQELWNMPRLLGVLMANNQGRISENKWNTLL